MFIKNFLITVLMSVCIFSVSAQNNNPTVTLNTVLNYALSTNAGDVNLTLKIADVNEETINLEWSINQLGNGRFIMQTEALKEGTNFYWGQPEAGADTKLDGNETLATFSTKFYTDLMENGKATYDAILFYKKDVPKDTVYKLNGKDIDQVYVESEDGKVKVWFLKDANVPVILKMVGNASGMDLLLESIE